MELIVFRPQKSEENCHQDTLHLTSAVVVVVNLSSELSWLWSDGVYAATRLLTIKKE